MTQTGQATLPHKVWNTARDLVDVADVWLARHLNRAPRHLPILVIMITDKCQLKCRMCGACDYSPGDHNMLDVEEWKSVVDAAARLRTRIISITGGESLLRKDLFDLIRYARSYGMAVHLNTNGLLLNKKNVALIKETGVETVSISIESTDPETHDAIRGKGMFARTVKGLRLLREEAPEVHIGLNCVINKHNLDSLPEMVPWSDQEGLDQVKFAPIHSNLQHKDKPVTDYEDMIFQEDDLDHFEDVIQEIQDRVRETELQTTSKRFFNGMSDLYRPPASNFYCYAGYAICTVDAQGNVAACFDKDTARNVREVPLDELWRSPEFNQHRQKVRNCEQACWDTTNCELSLRLSMRQFFRDPAEAFRAAKYYFTRRRNRQQQSERPPAGMGGSGNGRPAANRHPGAVPEVQPTD